MKTMVEFRVPDRVRISECSKKGKKKILELKETIGPNAGQQGFQHLGQEAGRRSKNTGEGKSEIRHWPSGRPHTSAGILFDVPVFLE